MLPWRRLCLRREMDPSYLLTTGQSFSWASVGDDLWVGVIDDAVLELRKAGEQVEFRAVFGSCEEKRIRSYFDLDYDYTLNRELAPASVLRVVDRRPGVRILQQDPLETLISFICSANNNIKRITQLCFALREKYGTFLGAKTYSDTRIRFHAFPNLSQLSLASPEELRGLGLGYRADYVFKTVTALSEGGIESLLRLRDLPTEEAREELVKYRGVGRKVADCVLLFGIGKRDVVPVDVHIKRIAKTLVRADPRLTLGRHFGIKEGGASSYEAAQTAFSSM
ncbi:7,8 dihydro-8-oxoguanine DNA glycosylase [Babesia ovata]|uniref:DNA-(apurinic or apyrimidinic site) lyase n=1 Tax=Babesia ovata TaxID=189622 RepID=A0A2H6KGW3_9APIC|nr:7,8 dihydro-8-oxoguanine DNA glycosylase [Babesia ovata]GBE62209.1 7,8 dihydro-8-oxoguanine DNA glycosylase [Babesia ovata]